MCGIFGAVSNKALTHDQRQFLESAMQAGQVRGLHGTGVMGAKWDYSVVHAAAAMTGTEFLMSEKLRSIHSDLQSARSIIGHNRHATAGAHSDENCHPFKFGHIVGVHNGTIQEAALHRIDPEKSHEVDSGRLYAAISRADNPLDVLRKIHVGSYSLVWYNTDERTLNLARSSARPMNIAVTKSGLYLASEFGMLGWLMARHKLAHLDEEIQIASTDVETLYTIPLEDMSQVTAEPYKIERPVYNTPKKSNKKTQSSGGAANPAGKAPTSKADTTSSPDSSSKPANDSSVPDPSWVSTFFNNLLTGTKEPEEPVIQNDLPGFAGVAGRVYEDMDLLEQDFPVLHEQLEFVRDCMFSLNHDQKPRCYAVPMVWRTDGVKTTLSGYVSTHNGDMDQDLKVMFSLTDYVAMLRSTVKAMPSYEDMNEGNVRYPIITGRFKQVEVKPTGEIVVELTTVPYTEPTNYVRSDDDIEAAVAWCSWVCDNSYLEDLDPTQLAIMWAELRARYDDYDDDGVDIPF